MDNKKLIGLVGGIFIFLSILIMPTPEGMTITAQRAAAITLLMAVWWITEATYISATALVPLVLFPMLGILKASQTAENYGHNYVLMLLGGFFIAKAFEVHHVHKRLALHIIRNIGTSRRKIIISFMIATALLSMWIANVAVTLIMLPIAMAIIFQEQSDQEDVQKSKFGLALLLGIAYSASVGGTGSLIGTPPNMVLVGIMEKLYPLAPDISFIKWMSVGVPLIIIFLPVIWFYLTRYYRVKGTFSGSGDVINKEIDSLGIMTSAEKRVLAIFVLTGLGWMFRKDIVLDNFVIHGWASLLGVKDFVHDATVALIACMILFLVSTGKNNNGRYPQQRKLLTWKEAESVPWGVVLIVGAGYSIAEAFATTGLASWIGNELAFIGGLPQILLLLIIVFLMIFITEINSNTATANIFLPVLATMAVAGGTNPMLLMIPATIACSFAFMLPSGTGTNAVIFGSDMISIKEMSRAGFWLNLICVFLLTLVMYFVVIPLFDISSTVPDWAK